MANPETPVGPEPQPIKYYGVFDEGHPTAFYVSDIYPPQDNGDRNAAIPAAAVEISEADWRTLCRHPWMLYIDGKVVDPGLPPPPPIPPSLITWSDQYEAVAGALTETPAAARVGWNTDDPVASTEVVIARLNEQGTDCSSVFAVACVTGNVLRIEARDNAEKFVSHNIVGAAIEPDDLRVTVEPRGNAGMPFDDNELVTIGVYAAGSSVAVAAGRKF